jgi:amino acid transporter
MTRLVRRLGLFALTAYAVGDILGAGIYALIGKVVDIAGVGAWVSFAMGALVALFTGFSYAELSARFPVAAGAAAFVGKAFPGKLLSTLTGVFVLGTGVTSAATVTVAFSDYFVQMVPVPAVVVQVALVGVLSLVSFWGIKESSGLNVALTFVEVSGLIAVIVAGISLTDEVSLARFWDTTRRDFELLPAMAGVTVAFFAYNGFEDVSNLAEEAKDPSRDLPRAILTAIVITTLLYLLVTLAVQIHIPPSEISAKKVPLLAVFEKAGFTWFVKIFSVIALIAISNTALLNLIMASRLMYGMSKEKLLPDFLGLVHAGRKTPWVGIVISCGVVLVLILSGGLKILAQTTSLLILCVFVLIHLSLLKLRWGEKAGKKVGIRFPILFPAIGLVLCAALITRFPASAFLRSGLILGAGFALWWLQRVAQGRAR